VQNAKALDRWLSSVRERIEGVFHEIQNTGRNLERLLAKTVVGLCARVITKMTSHLLRHLLLVDFGVNVQTFQNIRCFHIRRLIYFAITFPGGKSCVQIGTPVL
jgi:hypothetical protein